MHTASAPPTAPPTRRQELSIAIKKHQVATKDTRVDTPSREELLRVFTASTLPFVGFGFLDNLIMVRLHPFYFQATLFFTLFAAAVLCSHASRAYTPVAQPVLPRTRQQHAYGTLGTVRL